LFKHIALVFFLLVYGKGFYAFNFDSVELVVNAPNSSYEDKVSGMSKLSAYYLRTDTIKSLNFASEGLKLAESEGYIAGIIISSEGLARYFTEQGNYSKAKSFLHNCIETYNAEEYPTEFAAVYISLANIHDILSEFDLALDYYLNAEKLYELEKNQRGLGLAQMGIANIYSTTGFYKEAINYYKSSYDNLIVAAPKSASWSLNNMALSMMEIEENDSALFYFNKSLEMKLSLDDFYGASYTYTDLGTLYDKLGKNNLALESFEKALQMKTSLEGINPETIGSTYNKIGKQYIILGDYNMAIATLKTGIEYSEKSSSLGYLAEGYLNIANAYSKSGKYNEAFIFMKKYAETNKELGEQLSSNALSELKVVYETAQKDKDIELLNNSVALQDKSLKLQELEVQEGKRKNQLFTFLLVGAAVVIVLVLGLGWVLYRSNNDKKKANKLLAETNKVILEQKAVVEEKSKEIRKQKEQVEEAHKEITDSINYAERIQRSFLASKELLDENLSEYFVFFQPKEAVSGDFYWADKLKNGDFAIVNADSTGHGVPGAIMSILNISSLESAIKDRLSLPADIFNHTRKTIINRLKKDGSEQGGKDGMDASLISFNSTKTKMKYVAAQNPIWIIREGEVIEIKPEKMPVGKHDNDGVPFKGGDIDLQKGDQIYTLTDGFQDQFGGPKGKKFMVKKMREYVLSISTLPMKEQYVLIQNTFAEWKGEIEQVDDVCVIGIKI
jgi:serine phosphatase RsbU (regulator of sigma subunit)/Tfp pilus assembly protein PilF